MEVELCRYAASSSSLSPQCRRSVSQGLGSFQSPGAHPSELPAKLLLSLLHPLSLALLSFFVPLLVLSSHFFYSSCSAFFFTSASFQLPSYIPTFPSTTPLFAFTLLSILPLSSLPLLFLSQRSSSFAAVHNWA